MYANVKLLHILFVTQDTNNALCACNGVDPLDAFKKSRGGYYEDKSIC